MKFNEMLRSLRKSLNLTQKELAKELQASAKQISKFETSYNDPDINMLIKIADFFRCSVDYLLGRESEDGNIIVAHEFDYNRSEKDMVKLFRNLSYSQQQAMLRLMQEIVK